MVYITLDKKEEEQKIFDSINSTGQPLSSTDIIKNAIFDNIIKESNEEKAILLYEKYWEFEKSEELKNFWDTKIGERYNSEIFLNAFAVINKFFNYSKGHTIRELASLYKKHIENFKANELENFLQQIKEFATIYMEFPQIVDTKNNKTLFNFNDWRLRLFHIVDEYSFNITVLPLLLKLEYQLKDNSKILEQCYKLLEMLLLCNSNTKNYNNFFAKLTREIPKNDDEIYEYLKNEIAKTYGEYVNKEHIESWLGGSLGIANKDAKLILFWIELYREFQNKDYKDKTAGLHYEYQLEHIMPRSYRQYWSDIVSNEKEAQTLIYQIGNMTLLKGKLNNEIKNREWSIKLNGDKKTRNYISKNAELLINKELLDVSKWGENEIKTRTQNFIKDFFAIWNPDCFK